MSGKINKNGKGYPIGVIPQSLYDDVEDLKEKGFKLLWENQSPSSAFTSQNITLSSSDYDLLLIIARVDVTYSNAYSVSEVVPKGEGIFLNMIETASGNTNVSVISRAILPTSETVLYVNVAQKQTQGSARITDNDNLVPIKVYGIKI